jgi:hypothetical protein
MFKKKKEEFENLPDLPELPELSPHNDLPELPPLPSGQYNEEEKTRNALPSFPDSPIKKGFSQMAIKEAVHSSEMPEQRFPELPKKVQKKEWTPEFPSEPASSELMSEDKALTPSYSRSLNTSKDIYVKIEKYHSAKNTLLAIKAKLDEMDLLLKKIRETKMREEQELSSWEKEVSAIKTRVKEVSDNIFEKA